MELKCGTHKFNNLSKIERKALNSLKQDDSIIIKEADKGGVVVILNKDDCTHEVMQQLNDCTSYEYLDTDPTCHIMNVIKHTMQEGSSLGYIHYNTAKFLINVFPRVPNFYLLPKIHKAGFPRQADQS